MAELRSDTMRLRLYGKVNWDGLGRICRKLQVGHPNGSEMSKAISVTLSKLGSAAGKKSSSVLEQLDRSLSALDSAISVKRIQKRHVSLYLRSYLSGVCSAESLEDVREIINLDDDDAFRLMLAGPFFAGADNKVVTLASLLCALSYGSCRCLELLLMQVKKEGDDLGLDGNVIHLLVIKVGQKNTLANRHASAALMQQGTGAVSLLMYLLQQLADHRQHYMQGRDSRGRLPIHYAAQYGLSTTFQLLHDGLSGPDIDDESLRDSEGNTPLHLAISQGYAGAVRALLELSQSKRGTKAFVPLPGDYLAMALTLGSNETISSLLDFGVDVTYRNERGETLLYIAVRSAHEQCVCRLLRYSSCRSEQIDIPDFTYERTPLLVASVHGSLAIVKLLIKAGASLAARDCFSWSAMELAAYRGHISIVQELREAGQENAFHAGDSPLGDSGFRRVHLAGQRQGSTSLYTDEMDTRSAVGETQILVNLGSLNSQKHISAVDLSHCDKWNGYSHESSTAFTLGISTLEENGSSYSIQLPILDDTKNKPYRFMARDVSDIKLMIKVFYLETLVGSGVALLFDFRDRLDSKRESLIREFTIPILAAEATGLIGMVTLTVVTVTPFQPTTIMPAASSNIWKAPPRTQVVGHRDMAPLFLVFTFLLYILAFNKIPRSRLECG